LAQWFSLTQTHILIYIILAVVRWHKQIIGYIFPLTHRQTDTGQAIKIVAVTSLSAGC